jgi:hypothetical protein
MESPTTINFDGLPIRRSWKWSLPGNVLVALLAAFFNPPDQATTQGDFEVVERVVDGV